MARRRNEVSTNPTMIETSASQVSSLCSSTTTVSIVLSPSKAPSTPTHYSRDNGLIFKNPDANCTGYYADAHCIPWNVWMAMYFALWPTAPNFVMPNFDPVPGMLIQGPDDKCYGYRLNENCLDEAEFRRLMKNLTTLSPMTITMSIATAPSTSSPTSMASSTQAEVASVSTSSPSQSSTSTPSTPTPTPSTSTSSPPTHKSNPKLALITIPLVFLVLALIGGIWFWRRRKSKQASTSTSRAPKNPHANEEPRFTLGELYGGKVPFPELGEPALVEFEDEQIKGTWRPGKTYEEVDEERKLGWSRKGVKYYNEEHERRERERDRVRDEAEKAGRERRFTGEGSNLGVIPEC